MQETKCKGEKAKQIGEGYKIVFLGRTSTRNGVGIDKEIYERVIKNNDGVPNYDKSSG